MRALVVYDSKYGNTREIALCIGEGLKEAEGADVDVRSTADIAELPERPGLLVIGAPTQAHGIESTMRQFLDRLPPDRLRNVPVAVFDTRLRWPKLLSGSAAEGMSKRLARRGEVLVDEPESFFVEDKEGPLLEGETKRAADWGRYLFAEMAFHA